MMVPEDLWRGAADRDAFRQLRDLMGAGAVVTVAGGWGIVLSMNMPGLRNGTVSLGADRAERLGDLIGCVHGHWRGFVDDPEGYQRRCGDEALFVSSEKKEG